jgi:hypothetical protein
MLLHIPFNTFSQVFVMLWSEDRDGKTSSKRIPKNVERCIVLKKLLRIGAVVLVGILVIGAVAAWTVPGQADAAYGPRQNLGNGTGQAGQGAGWGVGDPASLSEKEIQALQMALDDEYKAWSVYDQVIADFGPVWPFVGIQQAEWNHITALVRLFDRYGLEVPENPWPGAVPAYESVTEACEAGSNAEIENAALYDQIFSMVDNPDIIRVFTNLKEASLTKHLPAFQLCAGEEPAGDAESFLPILSQ